MHSCLARTAGVVALAAATLPAASAPTDPGDPGDPLCFGAAAARYGVHESLLRAVAKVESNFKPLAVHFDRDGTRDVGVMQINSSHFERLRSFGITEDTLFNHPCTNVAVGTSILAGFIRQHGLTWQAVGAYGAGNSPKKEAARIEYAVLVSRALNKLNRDKPPVSVSASPGWQSPASVQVAAARPTTPRMLVLD